MEIYKYPEFIQEISQDLGSNISQMIMYSNTNHKLFSVAAEADFIIDNFNSNFTTVIKDVDSIKYSIDDIFSKSPGNAREFDETSSFLAQKISDAALAAQKKIYNDVKNVAMSVKNGDKGVDVGSIYEMISQSLRINLQFSPQFFALTANNFINPPSLDLIGGALLTLIISLLVIYIMYMLGFIEIIDYIIEIIVKIGRAIVQLPPR
ncbi:MAG: hypothetical protein KDH96_07720 [Candidatus Riesia sp.]|nr:hypothetical protein [Candidatus Riesia sp.]